MVLGATAKQVAKRSDYERLGAKLPMLPQGAGREPDGEVPAGSEGAVITERKVEVRPPALYKVLLLNDDYTPMDFVTDVLEKFFSKTHAAATEIMLAVHNSGVGVCGIFPYEIAETKVALVTEYAREHEHPLQCTMERA